MGKARRPADRRTGPAPAAGGAGGTGSNSLGNVGNAGRVGPPPASSGTAGAGGSGPPITPNTALTREPIAIDECGANNPAGLSPADVQKLKAGGGSPGAMKWLYPYEGTVFPRGMLAPDLMWDGPPADAVYVHIKSMIFEYWGCLKPTSPGSDHVAARSLGEGRGALTRQERLLHHRGLDAQPGHGDGTSDLENSDRPGRDQGLHLLQHLSLESDGRAAQTPGG